MEKETTNTKIGSYAYSHPKDRIGSGRFGTVYKSFHQDTKLQVAIKEIQLPEDEAAFQYKAFFNEVDILKTKRHSNICSLMESVISSEYKSPRYLYLVMDLCDCNLNAYLRDNIAKSNRFADLNLFTKIDMMHQLAMALKYLQTEVPYVAHRDIKPENILIKQRDNRITLLLSDFGQSKLLGNRLSATWSSVTGTPFFNAPEKFDNITRQFKAPSDIFSLGLVYSVIWKFSEQHTARIPQPISVDRHERPLLKFKYGLELLVSNRTGKTAQEIVEHTEGEDQTAAVVIDLIKSMTVFESAKRKCCVCVENIISELKRKLDDPDAIFGNVSADICVRPNNCRCKTPRNLTSKSEASKNKQTADTTFRLKNSVWLFPVCAAMASICSFFLFHQVVGMPTFSIELISFVSVCVVLAGICTVLLLYYAGLLNMTAGEQGSNSAPQQIYYETLDTMSATEWQRSSCINFKMGSHILSCMQNINDEIWLGGLDTIKVYDTTLSIQNKIPYSSTIGEIFDIGVLSNEELIVAGFWGLYHLNKHGKTMNKITRTSYRSIQVYRDRVYAADWKTKTIRVYQLSDSWKEISNFSLPCKTNWEEASLSVIHNRITVCCGLEHNLYVISLFGEFLKTYEYSSITPCGERGMPYICMEDETGLLVSDTALRRLQVLTKRGVWQTVTVSPSMKDIPRRALLINGRLYLLSWNENWSEYYLSTYIPARKQSPIVNEY